MEDLTPVEGLDGAVDVGSFHVEISGCVETGLVSEPLEEIFDVVGDGGLVHVEESGCVETGLLSELLVEIFDVVGGVSSGQVEVSGCVKTSLVSVFVSSDDVIAFGEYKKIIGNTLVFKCI